MAIQIRGLIVIQSKYMMLAMMCSLVLVLTSASCETAMNGDDPPPPIESLIGPTGDTVLAVTALPGRQRPIGALTEHEDFVYVLSEDITTPGAGNILYRLTEDLKVADSLVFRSDVSLPIGGTRMFIINENTLFVSSSSGNIFVDLTALPLSYTHLVENSQTYGRSVLYGDTILTYDQVSPTEFEVIYTTLSNLGQWTRLLLVDVDFGVNRARVRSLVKTRFNDQEILNFSVAGVDAVSDTVTQWFYGYDLGADTLMYKLPGSEYGANRSSTASNSPALVYDQTVFHRAGDVYVGLDLLSGEVLYTIDTLEGRSIDSNLGYPTLNGRIVLTASNGLGPQVGIDVPTGTVVWLDSNRGRNMRVTEAYGQYFLNTSVGVGDFEKIDAASGDAGWIWRSPLRESGARADAVFANQFAVIGEEAVIHDFYQVYRISLGSK